MKYGLFVWFLLISTIMFGQTSSLMRSERLFVSGKSLVLSDTLPIARGSIELRWNDRSINEYIDSVIYPQKRILLTRDINDTIEVRYSVLGFDFERPLYNKPFTRYSTIEEARKNPFVLERSTSTSSDILGLENFEKNGSVSRGLGLGNNQSVVLNSGFNLQLSGYLRPDVQLQASVTDDNLPFQPDGFTQQLQDFDRVFVQIQHPKHRIVVGDFDLTRPPGYFLHTFKNVKGLRSDNVLYQKKTDTLSQSVSVSAARGRFGRNVFFGREGNQGPYRLQGDNPGEFIVVLAGSERVYIDGILQQRGEQYEYIIDYNTAELTFTPNRLITNQSRIIVEFEYANQAYVRSLVFYQLQYRKRDHQFRFTSYREQDAPSQPLFQELNDEQRLFLSQLGPQTPEALYPGAVNSGFDPDRLRYKRIDSLGFQSVYVFSANPQLAIYDVKFSFVGQGRGDYVQEASTANGRVYRWVQPTIVGNDTIQNGSFAPVVRLVAPSLQSMSTIGAIGKIGEKTSYLAELALSERTLNRLSDQGGARLGLGTKLQVDHLRPLAWKSMPKAAMAVGVQYEYLDARFRTIQPYRAMEFARDWNLNALYSEQEEHLRGGYVALDFGDSSLLRYSVNELRAGPQVGLRQKAEFRLRKSKHDYSLSADLLTNKSPAFRGNYWRNRAGYTFNQPKLNAGIRYEQEFNRLLSTNTDTLAPNSYRFDIVEAFAGSSPKAAIPWQFRYNYRHDWLPIGESLLQTQGGHSYSLSTSRQRSDNHLLKFTATFRDLRRFATPNQIQGRETSYLTQAEYSGNFLKNAVSTQAFYAFSQGQELRRDIAFVEVPRGQGNFTWNDYNGNGIQELDEFEQAFFSDQANFIKIFIPGNSFVATFGNRFNQTLNLNPARLLKNKKGFLARWSNLTSISLERKNQGTNGLRFLNPFSLQLFDSSLVSTLGNVRNTLFFNRSNPNWGIDFIYQRSIQKNLLSGGFETRQQLDRGLKLRWNIQSNLSSELNAAQGERIQEADLFARRNYAITQYELAGRLNWSATGTVRFGFNAAWRDKSNTALELSSIKETLEIQEFGGEVTYNLAGSSSLQGSYSLVSNRFAGDRNSPAAYEMLQGLQPGRNQLWGLTLFRKLANNLQLNLSYNGRKAEESRAIHTGQLQARLVF